MYPVVQCSWREEHENQQKISVDSTMLGLVPILQEALNKYWLSECSIIIFSDLLFARDLVNIPHSS